MARLGWDWPTVLAADLNVIELALEGYQDLLKDVFGGGPDKPRGGAGKMTAEKFLSFAAEHNKRYQRPQQRRRGQDG